MQKQGRKDNILDFQKYYLQKKLKESGIKVIEDQLGKIRYWVRIHKEKQA